MFLFDITKADILEAAKKLNNKKSSEAIFMTAYQKQVFQIYRNH